MRFLALTAVALLGHTALAPAQAPAPIVDARINQYCHPPDECVLRGALLWDTTNVIPRYPELMRAVGIQGKVNVTFGVRRDGTVMRESIAVTDMSNRAFEQPVRNAVAQWRFRVSATEPPELTPTTMEVWFLLVDGCPAGFDRPLQVINGLGGTTRLMTMVCNQPLVPRH